MKGDGTCILRRLIVYLEEGGISRDGRQWVCQKRMPRLSTLAHRLNVHPRTIRRDFQKMADHGIMIERADESERG